MAEAAACSEPQWALSSPLLPDTLPPSVDEDLREMAALQEALITSEEARLEVGRALVDFRLEHNAALASAETVRYELQQRILDLEGRLAQGLVHQARSPAACLRSQPLCCCGSAEAWPHPILRPNPIPCFCTP